MPATCRSWSSARFRSIRRRLRQPSRSPRTMAEQLTPQERLQPALLDRLTDEEPDKKLELREQRVMSKTRLRQAVLRDLAWLFNATRLETEVDLESAPFARKSVIN